MPVQDDFLRWSEEQKKKKGEPTKGQDFLAWSEEQGGLGAQSEIGSMSPGGGVAEGPLRAGHTLMGGVSSGLRAHFGGGSKIAEKAQKIPYPALPLLGPLAAPVLIAKLWGEKIKGKSSAQRTSEFFGGESEKFERTGLKPGIPQQVVRGAGEAIPTIGMAVPMGGAGLPITGGISGYESGDIKDAALGAASGYMMGNVLHATQMLPTLLQPAANFVAGYVSSGGDIASGFTMTGLGLAGWGKRYSTLKDFMESYRKNPMLRASLSDKDAIKILNAISDKPIDPKELAKVGPKKALDQVIRATAQTETAPSPGAMRPPDTTGELAPDTIKTLRETIKQGRRLLPEQENIHHEELVATRAKMEAAVEGKTGIERARARMAARGRNEARIILDAMGGNKVPDDQWAAIADKVEGSRIYSPFEKGKAHDALLKLRYGELPQKNEIDLLGREFDPSGSMSKAHKFLEWWNIPKSAVASGDLSFPFRQGMYFIDKPFFWKMFREQYKEFLKPVNAEISMNKIKNDPMYPLAKDMGLEITEIIGPPTAKEELMIGAGKAEKIPLYGKVVRASNHAFTAASNKTRFDAFKFYIKEAQVQGLDITKSPRDMKALAKWINGGTGRASLGQLNSASQVLNGLFFSPRFVWSRLQLLNPVYYAKLYKQSPFVAKEAMKQTLSFFAIATTTIALAKLAGAKTETDPASADFGKIQIGNTRLDVFAGLLPPIRLVYKIASGKHKSSTSGKVTRAGDYEALNRWDYFFQFLESKEAPALSFFMRLLKGKTPEGKPFTVGSVLKEVYQRTFPMTLQDIIEVAENEPATLPLAVPSSFHGFGVQSYKTDPERDWATKASVLQRERLAVRDRAKKFYEQRRDSDADALMNGFENKVRRELGEWATEQGKNNNYYMGSEGYKSLIFDKQDRLNIKKGINEKDEKKDYLEKYKKRAKRKIY